MDCAEYLAGVVNLEMHCCGFAGRNGWIVCEANGIGIGGDGGGDFDDAFGGVS